MPYLDGFESVLLGESKAVEILRDQVRQAAVASVPVLICGPAGAGKEVTARAVHSASGREGPFMPINMSQPSEFISRNTELCDIRGGGTAFDPYPMIPADYQDCGGGTVFLKEICQLQPSSQVMLLHALKGRLFQPRSDKDDNDSSHNSFRLISASNVSTKHLLKERRFRESLLRRLGGVTIVVPSLAQRFKDIPILALYFLSILPEPDRPLGCTAAAMRRLQQYNWPGNIRELQHVITAAATLAPGMMLDEMAITFALDTVDRKHRVQPILADDPSYDEEFGRAVSSPLGRPRGHVLPNHLAKRTVSYWLRPEELPAHKMHAGADHARTRR